jgi:hypothetical protein
MTNRKNKFRQRDTSGDSVVGDYVEEANAVYVDTAGGNDGYSGDQAHPVRTLAAAIRRATVLGGTGKIIVQRGAYAEGNLTIPTGYSVEGVDRTGVIINGDGGATPVFILTGVTNGVRNMTIVPAAAHTAAIQCNGAGVYRIENVQITAAAAAATIGILHTAGLGTECIAVDINTAGGAATGVALQVVAGTIQFRDSTMQSNNQNLVDPGTCIVQNSTITTTDAGGAGQGVFGMSTGGTLTVIDSTLNNTNPAAAPNGYGIDNVDASAIVLNLINARLQNNGGYAAAGIPVLPEGAADPSIINNLGVFAPLGDVGFAAAPNGFENGVAPQVFQGIESPLWAGLGGGATPFAGADEHDLWSAIMRIARTVDQLVATLAGVGAGAGVALAAYAGGNVT